MAEDSEYDVVARFAERRSGIPRKTTILTRAARNGDIDRVRSLLSESGNSRVDVNLRGESGFTPLFVAVSKLNVPIAKLLLESGSDPNIPGLYPLETIPLLYAASIGNMEMVNLLLAHGADITVKTSRGTTVLHAAVNSGNGANLVPFLLSVKPELATEADNEGRLPDLSNILMTGIDPRVAPLSASRRMAATAMISRRAEEARAIAASHAATREAALQRNINEYYHPPRSGRRGRKTVKAMKKNRRRQLI
jgi:hypothetical protein